MKTNKKSVEKFFTPQTIAIAGVSRNTKKFGYLIFKAFTNRNYTVIPINPNVSQIDGTKCYPSVAELPENIQSLLIVTPKSQTDALLNQAIEKGIQNIWIQQFSETSETLTIASNCNLNIISKQCVFMHLEPVRGIHQLHRAIMKLFGKLPK